MRIDAKPYSFTQARVIAVYTVRYEYDGKDVYRLLAEEQDHGRIVALLILVRIASRALGCF